MTRAEVDHEIYNIIGDAIDRGHIMGADVAKIWQAIGRLSPEPKPKQQVPEYDPKKVKVVGTIVQRGRFTQEQRDAALIALRAVGIL